MYIKNVLQEIDNKLNIPRNFKKITKSSWKMKMFILSCILHIPKCIPDNKWWSHLIYETCNNNIVTPYASKLFSLYNLVDGFIWRFDGTVKTMLKMKEFLRESKEKLGQFLDVKATLLFATGATGKVIQKIYF